MRKAEALKEGFNAKGWYMSVVPVYLKFDEGYEEVTAIGVRFPCPEFVLDFFESIYFFALRNNPEATVPVKVTGPIE